MPFSPISMITREQKNDLQNGLPSDLILLALAQIRKVICKLFFSNREAADFYSARLSKREIAKNTIRIGENTKPDVCRHNLFVQVLIDRARQTAVRSH